MSKYIIKNCPLFCRGLCGADDTDCFCCNETDCLLKQIVELCNKIIFRSGNLILKGFSELAVGENFVAKQVLQLLDIQEVE